MRCVLGSVAPVSTDSLLLKFLGQIAVSFVGEVRQSYAIRVGSSSRIMFVRPLTGAVQVRIYLDLNALIPGFDCSAEVSLF